MKKYFEVLRRCPLFLGIADENLSEVLGCLGAKPEIYKKNQTIIAEGSAARYLGIVLSGTVQIVRVDFYGNRSIMAKLGETQIFGESFACAGMDAMPVDVMAAEDTEALLIDARRITTSCGNACEFHRQMIFNLLKVVATKNLILNQKIEVTSKRTTREKLMTYLLLQAKQKQSDSFTIPFDRQELADYLEVDRSGLSAEISKLRAEGMIECEKNCFRLLR